MKHLYKSRKKNTGLIIDRAHIDPVLGRYKSEEFIRLIQKWAGNLAGRNILKTDLREEAFGTDEILFTLSEKKSQFFAIDISEYTVKRAIDRQKRRGLAHQYKVADVRKLPFSDKSFDLVISPSTLDHFETEKELLDSIRELTRVVKPDGIIIIFLNNYCNLNFYFFLMLEKHLNLVHYPVRFFTFRQLKSLLKKTNLRIIEKDYCISIISPLNNILLRIRKYLHGKTPDFIAEKYVRLAKHISRIRKLKFLTSWFIAVKCVQKPE